MSTLDPQTITLGGLFVAGLAASLHCAGMCGLLSCGLGIAGQGSGMAGTGIYHAARLLGYGLAGALAGGIGQWIGWTFALEGTRWIPWLLAAVLLAMAFGLDRKLGAFPGFRPLNLRVRSLALRFPPLRRAALVGLATPLLPCGPLYAILALALASGSAIRGAEMLLAFGLGPVLAIGSVQLGSAWMSRNLAARKIDLARRALAVGGALTLIWHFSLFPGHTDTGEMTPATCRCAPTEP